jgi:hypothetical protein
LHQWSLRFGLEHTRLVEQVFRKDMLSLWTLLQGCLAGGSWLHFYADSACVCSSFSRHVYKFPIPEMNISTFSPIPHQFAICRITRDCVLPLSLAPWRVFILSYSSHWPFYPRLVRVVFNWGHWLIPMQ